MAQAVLATAAPADGRPDCPPHQADCLSPPQREKRERLHAAVAGHGSVPVAMPRTLPLQAHSPDEGGNQTDEGGHQGGHRHALSLMREAIRLMREAIRLMRETIRAAIGMHSGQ